MMSTLGPWLGDQPEMDLSWSPTMSGKGKLRLSVVVTHISTDRQGRNFQLEKRRVAGTINCMNIHQPLQHPPLGQDQSDEPSEKGETCNDFVENDLVQSILTKNTLNSNVSILKEDPPSPKTKTRIDNKSSPRPTQPEESSVSSVSSSQGKKHFKINILYPLLAAPYPGYDYELDLHLTD